MKLITILTLLEKYLDESIALGEQVLFDENGKSNKPYGYKWNQAERQQKDIDLMIQELTKELEKEALHGTI